MRHYEIVLLIHPDQSEQVPAMLGRYRDMVTTEKGLVHRVEDWGRRRLAYMINEVHKAHYVLFNVECSLDTLRELEKNFKFNDSILRSLVLRRERVITEQSALAKAKAEEDRIEAEKEMQTAREKSVVDDKPQKAAEVVKAGDDKPQKTAEVAKAGDDKPQKAAEVVKAGDDKLQKAAEVVKAGDDKLQKAAEVAKAGDDKQPTVTDKVVDESVVEVSSDGASDDADNQAAGEKESEQEKPAPQPETA